MQVAESKAHASGFGLSNASTRVSTSVEPYDTCRGSLLTACFETTVVWGRQLGILPPA